VAGKGLYLVGPTQGYKQVQDALDALAKDQGSAAFSNAQEVRIAEDGNYKHFAIPGILRPGSLGLVVSAAPGVEAVIAKTTTRQTGVKIPKHVKYVTIKGLIIKNFRYGITFESYSDYGTVNGCRVHNCSNWGIFSWNASYMSVVNNEVAGSRMGIYIGECRGSFIAHNSVYSAAKAGETLLQCGIFASHKGNMEEDITVLNNTVYAEGTLAFATYEAYVKDVVSDYNDLYAPGGAVAGVIHKAKTSAVRTIPGFTDKLTLTKWQIASGQDANTLSIPPKFKRRKPSDDGATVSLMPLGNSPILDKGADLQTLEVKRSYTLIGYEIIEDASAIPDWADSSLLLNDILGTKRDATPTIGAYERYVAPDPDPDPEDPFPTDADTGTEIGDLECGERVSVIDKSALQLAEQVPCWKPKVHRGIFFVRDMPYYLYASKQGLLLEDITFDEFLLDVDPTSTGHAVTIGGVTVPQSNWTLDGPKLQIHHQGLGMDYLGGDVVFETEYLDWDTGSDSFLQKPVRYELNLSRAKRRYFLPETPKDAAPIVITDDTINPLNVDPGLPGQFLVGDPVGTWGPEIEFRNPNLLRNAAFHYGDTLPEDWEYEAGTAPPAVVAAVGMTGAADLYPYHGDQFTYLTGADIFQAVPVDSSLTYSFFYHFATDQGVTGEATVHWKEYDSLKRLVKTRSVDPVSHSSITWDETGMALNALQTDTAWLEVHLSGQDLYVDALQVEALEEPSMLFTYIPRGSDMTVEYETSDARFYTVCDLDVSPFRNRMHKGFLHISSVPARQFDVTAPENATTLTDWRWAYGRTAVMPWSRLNGVNKWRRVRDWDNDNILYTVEDASYGVPVRQPADVIVEPNVPITRQSSRGVEFTAEVRNDAGNPYAFEEATVLIKEKRGAFPGYLARREYGFYTHLGQTIEPETNNRGEVAARFIPPHIQHVQYRGPLPPVSQGMAYVDVAYEVSKPNHGNPTVHDQFGTLVDLSGIDVTRVIHPRAEGDYSIYDLGTERPTFGTLLVTEADGSTGYGYPLSESMNSLMDDTEFFVDYKANRIALTGNSRKPITATYSKRLLWTDNQHTHRIYMDESVLTDLTGEMVLRYDAKVEMTVQADKPEGITNGRTVHKTVNIIAQNPHRGEVQ
jgi:parallel beta-helix repeat protein